MARSAALPFTLRRSHDVIGMAGYTSTKETVYGLLRVDGERLFIQWRTARETDRYGDEIRSDKELEEVREVSIPLEGVAGASVRRRWWEWPSPPRLVLTAADLRAFEAVTSEGGMTLQHPAELVLRLRRRDRLAAEEFTAELSLAVAELAAGAPPTLGDPGRRSEARTLEAGDDD
jgi:hypothetical protein